MVTSPTETDSTFASFLVDRELSAIRALVRTEIPFVSGREYSRASDRLEEGIVEELRTGLGPAFTFGLGGALIEDRRLHESIVRGQARGVAFFFAALLLLLSLLFRSVWFGLLSLVPSMAAGVVFYGMYGWMGYSTGITSGVSIALIIGVSVDDVLFLLLHFRRNRSAAGHVTAIQKSVASAGVAIIETTLVIVVGLSVFLLSFSAAFLYAGIATIVSLATATSITLLVIPHCLRLVDRDWKRRGSYHR